jgi:phenylalanyl-tRNA synthetase alpha chain
MFQLRRQTVDALIQKSEPINNITPNIVSHMNARLLHQPHHPLQIIKTKIAEHFKSTFPASESGDQSEFELFDDLHPVVSTKQCFDDLLIPADHIGRQPSDT